MKRKIVVSVISDLVSDQRVHKVCTFLNSNDFEVTLIGRQTKASLPLDERSYKCERIYCWFNKGVPLYAEFMLKLFARILFKPADILLSNDLDTLLPNFITARIKNKTLVYDSHEYFTGVPDLENSPTKKNIWKSLEKFILPKLKHAYTVNQSIASLYQSEYGIKMKVVRNVPVLQPKTATTTQFFPAGKTILLLQGSGINEERGVEELIESMTLLPESFKLYLIGSGTRWNALKSLTSDLGLNEKVEFIEKVPFSQLRDYTSQADLGLSLDKPVSTNYKLSLPNKIFDYIHAGIPVLSSPVVEVENVIKSYDVGTVVKEVTPAAIADAVEEIFSNSALYNQWRLNTGIAAEQLCWQREEKVLEEIFSAV